jgi:hypothetical protein
MLLISLAINGAESTTGQVPQRDTTKVLAVLPLADDVFELLGSDVARAGSRRASGETDIELGIFALFRLIQNV